MKDSVIKKGIILAAGKGKRLTPLTKAFGKQLLPVYDKPMIYYPVDTLMQVGIRDILLIITENDQPLYRDILGDGKSLGISITYEIQNESKGIPDAFIIGRDFIGDNPVMLMLGDNLFHPVNLIKEAVNNFDGHACVFGIEVPNPHEFGIAEIDDDDNVVSLEEKPFDPKGNIAVTGCYIFDNSVVDFAPTLKPSERGELEIVDVMNFYLEQSKLKLVNLSDDSTIWFDTGSPTSMLRASLRVAEMESFTEQKIGCLEETALMCGYIDRSQFDKLVADMPNSAYKQYLLNLKNG